MHELKSHGPKMVTDMYLYLRTEHTQLTQEFKSKQRSEQVGLKSLRGNSFGMFLQFSGA